MGRLAPNRMERHPPNYPPPASKLRVEMGEELRKARQYESTHPFWEQRDPLGFFILPGVMFCWNIFGALMLAKAWMWQAAIGLVAGNVAGIALWIGIFQNRKRRRRLARFQQGYCPDCGYDLGTFAGHCPGCGRSLE